jgi:hypothetical protein
VTARADANTSAVTGTTPGGAVDSATVAVNLPLQAGPAISIQEIANVISDAAARRPVTYTDLVTDNGSTPLHGVTVIDDEGGYLCGPLTLTVGQPTAPRSAAVFGAPHDTDITHVALRARLRNFSL